MVKSVDIVSSAVVETDYEEIKGLLMANQSAIKDLKKEISQLRTSRSCRIKENN